MENGTAYNMMDIFAVAWQWRKKIMLVTLIITAITTVIVFLVPPQYLSQTTILAANPILGDRSNIFRNTFEQPFYYFGGEGDNDRLYEMARNDSMKKFLIDSFKLEDHYKISKENKHRSLAAFHMLKKNMTVEKTDLEHIRIKVWDNNSTLAAAMANAIVAKLNQQSIAMLNEAKATILAKLMAEQQANISEVKQLLEKPDPAVPREVVEAKRTSLLKQIEDKDNLINQFKTSINNVTNVYVLEYAYPASKINRPQRFSVILLALMASFFFSLLTVLFLHRLRKSNK
jgi:uncharacterized protein involved in exopolysaccharide biosynthesis